MTDRTVDLDELESPRGGRSVVGAAGLVLAAAAAGVAVGMLIAPESGERIRERLRDTFREGWDDMHDGADRGMGMLRNGGKKALHRIEDRLESLEEGLEDARRTAVDSLAEPLGRLRGERRGSPIPALVLGAALAWFLTSNRTADVREQMRAAAKKAGKRAADEWERFQERSGFTRRGTGVNGDAAGEMADPI